MQDKLKFPQFAKLGLRKLPLQNNGVPGLVFLTLLIALSVIFYLNKPVFGGLSNSKASHNKFGLAELIINTPTPTPTPTPSPSPTPKPLTFAQMSALYGPCVRLPVLMYHHIQSKANAIANKQTSLTVDTDFFKNQMQYLKDRGYNTATMSDLVNFFDSGTPVATKSVLLTFDDGYADFYSDAFPILSSMGFHATMFTPTGLIQNPDYLTWDQISGMNGLILFANHTWSHKNVQVSNVTMQSEIKTADIQLSDHGLNVPKVFAYPYGLETPAAESFLSSLEYKLAFTTVPGGTLCKKQRFSLPRIRIGNSPLSNYGF